MPQDQKIFSVGDTVVWKDSIGAGANNQMGTTIIGKVVSGPEITYKVMSEEDNITETKAQSELRLLKKGGMKKTKKIRRNHKGKKQRKQTRGRKQRGGVQELNPMDFKTAYLSPPHGPTGQSVADLVPREQYLRSPYGEYQRGGYQDEIIRPMLLKEAYPGKNLDPSGQPAY